MDDFYAARARTTAGASLDGFLTAMHTRNGPSPIAEDGIKRIGELYRIEAELRGLDPQARLAGRQSGQRR